MGGEKTPDGEEDGVRLCSCVDVERFRKWVADFSDIADPEDYENPQAMLRPVYSRFDYYLCKAFFDIR